MRKRCAFVVLLASLTLPTLVLAQGNGQADLTKFDDPDARSTGTGSANRIVLQAGDADARATARLAGRFSPNRDTYGRYSFTVTAPFDSKKADRVEVGSLSGLTAGSSATLEFSAMRWRQASGDEQDAMTKVCEKYIPQLVPGYTWEIIEEVTPFGCQEGIFEEAALGKLIKAVNDRRAACAKCRPMKGEEPPLCESLRASHARSCAPARDGTPAAGNDAICALLDKGVREACASCKDISGGEVRACADLEQFDGRATLIDDPKDLLEQATKEMQPRVAAVFRPLTLLTVAVTANTQHFAYVLEENLDETRKTDKGGSGITVALTRVLQANAWTLGYSHERSYKGADKVQLCRPLGTTGATTCTEAVVGAPEKQTSEIAFLQNHAVFTAGRFGIAPRVEFDLKKSRWAARLPVYFIANEAQELTAGLAVGYSEAQDQEFGATVFISKAFAFY